MKSTSNSFHRLVSLLPALLLSLNVLAGCARTGGDSVTAESPKLTLQEASCAEEMNERFAEDEQTQIDWYMNHGGVFPAPTIAQNSFREPMVMPLF